MTDMPPSAWKVATILLATILVTVVIASGLMKLGLSVL